jgi:hypothetical protein
MPRSALTVAAALAAFIFLAAAARADGFEVAVQDDETIVYQRHDRGRALEQMRAMGATHVRINVLHVRGDEPLDAAWGTEGGGGPYGLTAHSDIAGYDSAVDAVLAAGMRPQLTLVWYGTRNAIEIAGWAQQIAEHFAGRVERFSVLNEPDMTLQGAPDECDPKQIRALIAEGRLSARRVRSWRYKRVRRGNFRRVAHTTSTGSRRYVYKRTRRGRGKFTRKRVVRRVTSAGIASRGQDAVSIERGCALIMRGRAYRRIFLAAAPRIRRAAAGAQVLAGETSPTTGDVFIKEANRGGALPADGWAHHPYSGYPGGLERTAMIQAAAGMPVYATEFGLFKGGHGRPELLESAWRGLRAAGVRQVVQYGWYDPAGGRWNTSVADPDGESPEVAAIARAVAN